MYSVNSRKSANEGWSSMVGVARVLKHPTTSVSIKTYTLAQGILRAN
jgi:hypothetical protein